MKRIITIILSVAIMATFITGCGKNKKVSISSENKISTNNSTSSLDSADNSSS